MTQSYRKIICFVLVAIFSCSLTTVCGASDLPLKEKYTYGSSKNPGEEYSKWMNYPYYATLLEDYNKNGYKPAAAQPVVIQPQDIKLPGNNTPKLVNNVGGKSSEVFMWDDSIAAAEWNFNIAAAGLYEVEIEYYMPSGSGNPATRSLKIDDKVPFIEAGNISFQRMWRDAGEPVLNSIGDEARPGQVEVQGWRKTRLIDSTGFYSEPFKFYFQPGRHTITLDYVDQNMAIAHVSLIPCEEIPSYSSVKEQYNKKGYKKASQSIEFEAESNAVEKSDPIIRRETGGDPLCQPYSSSFRKLNIIGGTRWSKGNQSVTFKFNVPQDGLYKLGVRELQSFNDGNPSYRQIAIDGKVPFKELLNYSFIYTTKWKSELLQSKEGEPYLFFLTEGEHTLTMTVKMGDLTPIIQSVNDDALLLSNVLTDIYKVTGSNPDPNYDYEFFKTIPNLKTNLETLSASMQKKYDIVKGMSEKTPAMANNFLTIKTQLNEMIKDPFSIARRLKDMENAQISLGTWYLSMQNQPLFIDYIKVMAPDEYWENSQSNIFQKIRATFKNFMISFKKDYDSVGSVIKEDVKVKNYINVWVARGSEWAELIKEMADEDFTPKTGIMVNINVLPANQLAAGSVNALMLSITSGRAPDVGMGVGSGDPVEFAIRDAVVDISKFSDFDTVSKRFIDNIFIPYRFRGGIYALPETMDFNALFYRKDIMADLGLKLPDTREDLYSNVLPLLYQNGMQFSYPPEFTQFIFQHGGDFYSPDGKKSALDTPEAFRAFKENTEMYTNYGIPAVASFYTRFRQGIMPMGIDGFGTYMQLSVAAPELAGRWGIAPLPGTKKSDGTIDRSNGVLAGQCDIILKQSNKQQEAWEFLKWWSSEPIQTQFARELEAVIGTEARWNTANLEAFTNLSWKQDDLSVIKEQWKWAREMPNVLGGYFTTRHLNNAWNSVVISGQDVRDSLEKAVKEINKELRTKQEEYGIFDDKR